ncbi:hypothetical protein BGZ63DRAFT_387235 [Mariannaea sp. PMI_226]|nr:hypothetical protein BGZ63DRAFT_387235 [Mariannaea sp. PMI_226]
MAKRACDACRLRKVRCNGRQPCQQCGHLNLGCIFSPRTNKRQPVRGRLIAQLRNEREKTASGSLPEIVPLPCTEDNNTSTTTSSPKSDGWSSPQPRPLLPSPHTEDFISLIPLYEEYIYPFSPIITGAEVLNSIKLMQADPTHAAFVYAFAAVTISVTHTPWRLHSDTSTCVHDLMSRSLAVRYERHTASVVTELLVTARDIMTCIFLEICSMNFKRIDRAFVFLREAIAMLQILRVERPLASNNDDPNLDPGVELPRRQRLYWELFIHERFLTIIGGFPSILRPLSTGLPAADPSIPPNVQIGFRRIIRLFLIMDSNFLQHWMAQDGSDANHTHNVTAQWVEYKHQQLDDDEIEAERDMMALLGTASNEGNPSPNGTGHENLKTASTSNRKGLTELQQADLVVTRLWLRTLVWQLAMSRYLLRSELPASAHEAMSLVFPAKQLMTQLRSLITQHGSIASMRMHGIHIILELFEVTNTIADVMALVPAADGDKKGVQGTWRHGQSRERIEEFLFLADVLFSFDRIDQVQRDIISTKLEALREMFNSTAELEANKGDG